MKKIETIFDKHSREEDLNLLKNDKSTQDEEKTKMLLRRYNIEIFEPDIRDLNCPEQREIDMIMEKTKSLRPSNSHNFFSIRYFAYAASVLVVCGLTFSVLKTNYTEKNMPGSGSSGTTNTQFRGVAPVAPATPAKDKKDSEPLAYLVDMQGKIEIVRQGGKKNAPSSCEVLYKGDVVVLADKAKAKVMYSDAFFNVSGPMQYKIEDPDPVAVSQNNDVVKRLKPTITTRGMHWGLNTTPPIVMPPRTLLASAVTPITRAGIDGISVFSPKGASFTDKPIVRIGGDPNLTYTVSILDLEGTVIGKSVTMKGNTQQGWTNFTNTPIVEDEIYTLRVQQNGKIVNDINNASFWLLSKQDKEKVSVALKYVDSVESEQERTFFQANAFYMNGCYAEAYAIVKLLTDKYSGNALYLNLVQLTRNALKIK